MLSVILLLYSSKTFHSNKLALQLQSAAAEEGSVEMSKLGQWLAAVSNLTVDGGSKVCTCIATFEILRMGCLIL